MCSDAAANGAAKARERAGLAMFRAIENMVIVSDSEGYRGGRLLWAG